MRVLIIPDIHENESWQKLIPKFSNYDKVVQLGDWFDAWSHDWEDNKPIKNFQRGIEALKSCDNFDILLGNHDMQYITGNKCSGYQAFKSKEIKNALLNNAEYLKIAVEYDGWVFSHAGFSSVWMRKNKFSSLDEVNNVYKELIKLINLQKEFGDDFLLILNKKRMKEKEKQTDYYKINWTNYDEKRLEALLGVFSQEFGIDNYNDAITFILKCRSFNFCGCNTYGDDPTQGPLWIRPRSLLENMYFEKQVVGHTELDTPPTIYIDGEEMLVITDNHSHECFFELNTKTNKVKKIKI